MGLFDFLGGKSTPDKPSSVTFTVAGAGHRYDDNGIGLLPVDLTIGPDTRRVAIIGLNGSGKTTLLKLLDGALKPSVGTVTVAAGDETLDTANRRDLKRIEDLVGRVRREEIPESYYQAKDIREAIDQPLKKHKVPEAVRQETIGALFAHFDLTSVAMQPASALDSEKRHLLAIASALSFSPAAVVADEPTKGLDEIGSAHVARALFSYDKQVIFATHDLELIQRPEYAIDRTIVLDEHDVVFDGSPADAAACYTDLVRKKYEETKQRQ
ncbi:energy-coupling factor ABC transporter ATP-binding protein [Bifidobacterium amazonense]|uniref:Energy-coupling factor ABC transporter ATP-binding protein n=1 Tax=Bifidobacterium amazonense TaxID=2809027 RepID=A0ABS9VSR3_9BIFI|nr:energy-coupling factor ABC transporter ATP-binding protein [Bifidobacterium amazonense]MCH9274954.1 energy-coupling factor ABC transporter ATP-binding protein [Bifidobacterium amazonense]